MLFCCRYRRDNSCQAFAIKEAKEQNTASPIAIAAIAVVRNTAEISVSLQSRIELFTSLICGPQSVAAAPAGNGYDPPSVKRGMCEIDSCLMTLCHNSVHRDTPRCSASFPAKTDLDFHGPELFLCHYIFQDSCQYPPFFDFFSGHRFKMLLDIEIPTF